MLIQAKQSNTRQSPRKVRLVANAVRKLSLEKALQQLAVIEKKATMVVTKTMQQAIANATHNHGYQIADLSLENILVTEGPRYRRFRAVSRGRAHNIVKRTCHVTVILRTAEAAKATTPTKVIAAPTIEKKATKKTTVTKKEAATKTAAQK